MFRREQERQERERRERERQERERRDRERREREREEQALRYVATLKFFNIRVCLSVLKVSVIPLPISTVVSQTVTNKSSLGCVKT